MPAYTGTIVFLTVSAINLVPEPATLALMLVAGTALLARRSKKAVVGLGCILGIMLLLMFEDCNGTSIGTGAFYQFNRNRSSCEWGRLCFGDHSYDPRSTIEASYLALCYAFDQLKLKRIHCASSAQNTSVCKLNQLLGFTQEGIRKKHLLTPDGYHDVIEYGLFPDAFFKNASNIKRFI